MPLKHNPNTKNQTAPFGTFPKREKSKPLNTTIEYRKKSWIKTFRINYNCHVKVCTYPLLPTLTPIRKQNTTIIIMTHCKKSTKKLSSPLVSSCAHGSHGPTPLLNPSLKTHRTIKSWVRNRIMPLWATACFSSCNTFLLTRVCKCITDTASDLPTENALAMLVAFSQSCQVK